VDRDVAIGVAAGAVVGSAALSLLGPRLRRPRSILTTYVASDLPSGWAAALGPFWAISPKAVSGASSWRLDEARAVLATGERSGLVRQCWGGHSCLTPAAAEAEAETAARVANGLRATAYYWNAEDAWAAGDDPIGNGIKFAKRFRELAPGVALAYQAYTSWSQGWPIDSPGLVGQFSIWSPQLFGTTRGSISKKWAALARRHAAHFPTQIVAPLVGSGRLAGGDRAWGYLDQRVELAGQYRPDWLLSWIGVGSSSMVLEGNRVNPPVSVQAQAVKGLVVAA
jgi:hypothetical protein